MTDSREPNIESPRRPEPQPVPNQTTASVTRWWPWLAVAVIWTVTEFPFWLGTLWAPPGTVFDGLTGMVADQHMYFSFIRQAAEGAWLFENRLTHLPHDPAMFNLQWLLVGWLTADLGDWAYPVWRFCGIVLLIHGFWWLLGSLSRTSVQRVTALWLGVTGGGFGWLFQVLDGVRIYRGAPLGMLDVSDGLCHPFAQMLLNPHISVSHGLTLFSLGCLIRGEQAGRWRWTLGGGILTALNGLMRPYDMIVLCAVLPCYVVLTAILTRKWSWSAVMRQSLPGLCCAPVLIYYLLLFQWHPVFRYWSSQGIVTPLALHWHLVNLGLAGMLALWRGLSWRRLPLTAGDQFLAVWIVVTLLLFHAHQLPGFGFMPYTPLLGSALGPILLAFGSASLPLSSNQHLVAGRTRAWGPILLAGLLLVNSLSSAVWMVKIVRNLARFDEHYIPIAELEAARWLDQQTQPDDVVCCTLPTGNRFARYVSARFVVGHINITPRVREVSERLNQLFRCELTTDEALGLLGEYRVRWIVCGPRERDLGSFPCAGSQAVPVVTPHFENAAVTVYSVP